MFCPESQRVDRLAIVAMRQMFRNALQRAKDIVDRADISNGEAGAARAVLRTYGTENDGNGVVVAERTSAGGAAFTREENGKIIVAITPSELFKPTLWLSVFHEGVHVFQSRFHSLLGLNPSLAGAEFMAYHAQASVSWIGLGDG